MLLEAPGLVVVGEATLALGAAGLLPPATFVGSRRVLLAGAVVVAAVAVVAVGVDAAFAALEVVACSVALALGMARATLPSPVATDAAWLASLDNCDTPTRTAAVSAAATKPSTKGRALRAAGGLLTRGL